MQPKRGVRRLAGPIVALGFIGAFLAWLYLFDGRKDGYATSIVFITLLVVGSLVGGWMILTSAHQRAQEETERPGTVYRKYDCPSCEQRFKTNVEIVVASPWSDWSCAGCGARLRETTVGLLVWALVPAFLGVSASAIGSAAEWGYVGTIVLALAMFALAWPVLRRIRLTKAVTSTDP